MDRKKVAPVVFFLLMGAVAFADHNTLLPRPQQIQYGSGGVPLRAVTIEFAGPPNQDDRFAAEELRKWIRSRTGLKVLVAAYGSSDNGSLPIILDREGKEDVPLALPGEKPGPDSREAYNLIVTASSVKIRALSSAGIYYGAQTLRQLIEGEGIQAVLPVVDIHDWPSMAYRGTMVDMSHGPLPLEKEIEQELDFLARWKANQYYLYTEDSVALSGYPLLNPNARLSQDEVRRIVAYGRERHIDIIPNFDLYGHQHDFFRIEQYAELSDEPHGTEFNAANEKVETLLTDWVNQFAELFPSPFVSIGFDETLQLQVAIQTSGSTKQPGQLFVKQLSTVAGLFKKRGKTVMAYDDIMVKYPEVVPQLPSGLIAVAWAYTSVDPNYNRWLGPLVAHHIPHVVQTAVTSWDKIAPDYDATFDNVDTFLAAGRKSGALGLVNSVWADDAQILFRMSLPGMAYGAAAPWQSVPLDRADFFSEYARLMYPSAAAPEIASALSNMTIAETNIRKLLGLHSMFGIWEDPFFPAYYKKLAAHRDDLHQTRMHAEAAETSLYQAEDAGADKESLNSLMIGCRMLDYAGEKFQTALDLTDIWSSFGGKRPDDSRWWNEWRSRVTYTDHSFLSDLMDAITDLEPAYRAEWLEEYKPYRLGTALGRWDAENQYWRHVGEKLSEFNDSIQAGDMLPPLEEVIESPQPAWAPASQ